MNDNPLEAASVAVVFGAAGGIGSALVRRLDGAGQHDRVMGIARGGADGFDLTDEASIVRTAARIAAAGELRLAIDATGFLHDDGQQPEKSWRDIDAGSFARAFALNVTGPALLMKHCLPLLPASGRAVFATLSARVGSIGDNRLGGWYAYRASKAALNQVVRTAAVELRRRRPSAICVALHPGTVATRLSAPFARTGLDVQPPQQAAMRLLAVIDALRADQSGGFFDQSGAEIPW